MFNNKLWKEFNIIFREYYFRIEEFYINDIFEIVKYIYALEINNMELFNNKINKYYMLQYINNNLYDRILYLKIRINCHKWNLYFNYNRVNKDTNEFINFLNVYDHYTYDIFTIEKMKTLLQIKKIKRQFNCKEYSKFKEDVIFYDYPDIYLNNEKNKLNHTISRFIDYMNYYHYFFNKSNMLYFKILELKNKNISIIEIKNILKIKNKDFKLLIKLI